MGYYRNLGFDANMSKFYLVLPLIVITSTVVFPIGMYLSKEINSRFVILTGGVIAVGTCLLASLTRNTTMFFLLYAVGFGFGKGFMYPAPLVAGWSHLPGRKGFVSGVIVCGIGFGALVFGILAQKIVNPDNLAPAKVMVAKDVEEPVFDESVNSRVPIMLQTLCLIWTFLIVIGVVFVSNFRKEDEDLRLLHQLEQLMPASATMSQEEIAEINAPVTSIIASKDFI